ncbi:MAG: TrbI/VirB10 family protein [Acetobacter sp.]|nr:TrbI/VirB10 family protein [Acetobacter sp.]
MFVKKSKLKCLILSVALLLSAINNTKAADISAIDLDGNLIGKVIPDGSVIDFENELIGHITADGYTVNDDNVLIGGIVPQGIAISYKNEILGKVNNDGTVTAANNDIVGKVLPNGLVVNDNYDILGAVISPGLVYDDRGKIIGRVSGDGYFYNLSGEKNGYVTASGYVFAQTGGERYNVVGRLISSKMVIAANGKFLGSIAPDGRVTDLNKNTIANIHANGFAYNADGNIIGHIVNEGYAFTLEGSYLGIVSYNGDILDKGKVIGTAVIGNRAISKSGELIGFTISQSATANTLDGKYLGRIVGNGNIVKSHDIIGKIGASGNVIDNKGQVIGIINSVGPIFDYLGNLRGNAAVGGKIISLDNSELGYIQQQSAFDKKGKEFGRVLDNRVIYSNNGEFIGVNGIASTLNAEDKEYTISPYGYVFDESGVINGRNIPLSNIIDNNGKILSYTSIQGKTENNSLNEISKLTSSGILIDKNNKLLGKNVDADYATDFFGTPLGYPNFSNLIVNNQNQLDAQIFPNDSVFSLTGNPKQYKGQAGNAPLSISINGDYLGANRLNGQIRKSGEIVGVISADGYALDNMGALYGVALSYGVVVTPECKFLGVVSDNGDAKNAKGNRIGTILANRQVISDTEEVMGYIIYPQGVWGDKGEILGVETPLGSVLNYDNRNLGCQDINGNIRNSQNEIIGRVIQYTSIMGFNNQIIGKINSAGFIADDTERQLGYIGIDAAAYSLQGENLGVLFDYKVAFDDNNTYLGRVNANGEVLSDTGNILGHVDYNGLVHLQDGSTGFALYDLYVYDNEEKTVGYIAKNGTVYSIMGDVKGTIHHGFVLDKKQKLIARGKRDYLIRDDEKNVIGYLNLDGNVVNYKNILVGTLTEDGEIVDSSEKVIAAADPLQYYHKSTTAAVKQGKQTETKGDSRIEDKSLEEINENIAEPENDRFDDQTSTEIDEETPNADDIKVKHKIVGIALTPGGRYIGDVYSNNEVIDAEGNVVGNRNANGEIVDVNGNIIGGFQTKDKENNRAVNKNWWESIMKGVIVSAHGTGNEPVNVGPGGGIGPGERYNPRRAEIIAQLQNSRRQSMAGKSISSNFDAASYTGWQDNWDGITRSISTLRVDMSNMITADKPIPAVLARSLISLGNVPITAIVERNVYGDMGRNVIIPAGSRIIGGLNDGGELDVTSRFDGTSGGVKLKISWQRIIRPDGIAFLLDNNSQTGDAQGRGGGALGYVDEQMVKKYTMPLVGTLATSAITYMMAADEDATGEVETSKQQAASDARQQFMEKMNEILDEIIESKSQIEPVTFVPAGTRIIIYPMTDLWLRSTKEIEKGETSSVNKRHKDVLIDDNETTVNTNNNTSTNTAGPRVQNNQGQNQSQNAPLIGNDTQQNQQKQTVPGAIPPPAADGTVSDYPDSEEEMTGDIELF